MASARYWRLIGCKPYGYKSDLSLSEIALYAGVSRVDTGLTCTYSPASGSLSNLSDASTSTVCTFADADLSKANFELRWDLGSAQEVTSLVIGSADTKGKFLAEALLQASTDGSAWIGVSRMRGVSYPGANATATVSKLTAVTPSALCRFEGTAGSKAVVNAYGTMEAFTFGSTVQISTTQAYAGLSSMSFPGGQTLVMSSSYAAGTNFTGRFASDSFTASAWIYPTALGGYLVGSYNNTGASQSEGWAIFVSASGAVTGYVWVYGQASSIAAVTAAGLVSTNSWQHVAFEKEGSTLRVYVNGVLSATTTNSAAAVVTSLISRNLAIGCLNSNISNTPFTGYIDELMLLDSVALYGGLGFTPAPWEDQLGDSPSAYAAAAEAWVNASVARDVLLFSNPTTDTQVKTSDAEARRDMLLGGNGVINGTVKEKSTPTNVPLYRRVRLIEQRSGYPVAETWSNATTGNYSFANIDRSLKYTVVSYDHTGLYRAVIADNLTPDLMT